jgi:hypothetical protein
MNESEYKKKLQSINNEMACAPLLEHTSVMEYLEKNYSDCLDIINHTKETMTIEEQNNCEKCLEEFYYFIKEDRDTRTACFQTCFNIEMYAERNRLIKRCIQYDETQYMFSKHPDLYKEVRGRELVNFDVFDVDKPNESVLFSGEKIKLDSGLHISTISEFKELYPYSNIFIRIDPNEVLDYGLLLEHEVRRVNPQWIKKLSLHRGNFDNGIYSLDNPLMYGNVIRKTALWENLVKRISRLEIAANRKEDNYLSMMMEELCKKNKTLMVGKCIHLDTHDKIGCSYDAAIINHIDLAINIYFDNDAINRQNNTLRGNATTTNATYRTHLLRIENIPLKELPRIAFEFFDSSILTLEWYLSQIDPAEYEKYLGIAYDKDC